MSWLILAGLLLIALVAVVFRAISGRSEKTARISHQRRDFLFSPEQRFFFVALQQAVGENYEIFGKIRLGDVVTIRGRGGRKHPPAEFGPLGEEFLDFVLCHKADLSIACAVQLQEHLPAGRKSSGQSDLLKPVCQAAGLPLVRFEAGPLYDACEIREAITTAVRKDPLYLLESDGRREPSLSGLENLDL